tara:strand:- start:2429 stop:3646 length:1218 start_codon:yes stop_codon:yes gene_type:complete
MNILLISENFFPEKNAPAKRLYEHAKKWVELGHNVKVITGVPNAPKGVIYPGYKNKLFQKEMIDGIEVIRVWTFIAQYSGFILRTLDFLSFMITSLFFGIFTRKVDIIISTTPQFLPVISGYILSKIKSVPFILELRDLWPESIVALNAMKKNSPIIKVLQKIANHIYKRSKLIVVVTDSFKDYLIKIGIDKNKIIVIKNGFNFNRSLTPTKSIDYVREDLNLKNNTTVSYIGTIGMAHGVNTILETAKICKDVNFLIIGEGAEKTNLKLKAKNEEINNVIFIDAINWQEIVNINQLVSANIIHLKKLDLFKTVIPSKIFESMALKKPILAGLIGESLEIILSSESGIGIEPENELSLKNAIDYIQKNPNDSKKLGINGYNFAKENYNRDVLAEKMINRIEQLIK